MKVRDTGIPFISFAGMLSNCHSSQGRMVSLSGTCNAVYRGGGAPTGGDAPSVGVS